VKVICIPGLHGRQRHRHGVIDEAARVLQKPLTVEGLTRKVRAVLDATAR